MKENLHLNADRFLGFADVYDNARPKCPEKVKTIILKYLGKSPSVVVDLGCGTGLSTTIWSRVSNKVIGIEPSNDMIKLAREKSFHLENVEFIKGADYVVIGTAFSKATDLKGIYLEFQSKLSGNRG